MDAKAILVGWATREWSERHKERNGRTEERGGEKGEEIQS